MRFAVLVTAAFVAAPTSAHAQFIGGTVRPADTTQAAPGIHVVAIRGHDEAAQTVTDSSGTFYLGPLDPGVYRLRIGDGTPAPFFTDTLRVTPDGFVQRQLRMDATATRVYYEFEVAKIAVPLPGARGPRYPRALRDRHVSGEVIAQFVVDTAGRVEDGSFGVLSASDSGFVGAVADAVRTIGFFPAQLPNGRKVRELVHMPFQFTVR